MNRTFSHRKSRENYKDPITCQVLFVPSPADTGNRATSTADNDFVAYVWHPKPFTDIHCKLRGETSTVRARH
jgi:hypothetical protein